MRRRESFGYMFTDFIAHRAENLRPFMILSMPLPLELRSEQSARNEP